MDEEEFVFQSGGDACGVCMALNGTACANLPHDNCHCQIVPRDEKGCDHSNTEVHVVQYGPGDRDFKVVGEFSVTCPDGSEIGQSMEIDAASLSPMRDADGLDWSVEEAMEETWEELCDQCAEEPFRCC